MIEEDDQEVPVERFTCRKCGKRLSRTMFDTYRAKGKVGIYKTCHMCRLDQMRAWRKQNHERCLESKRKSQKRRRDADPQHRARSEENRRYARKTLAKRLEIEALIQRGYRTTPEMAKLYYITTQSLTRASRLGTLKAIKLGSDWYIHEESLQRYLFESPHVKRTPEAEALIERGYRTPPELATRYPITRSAIYRIARRGLVDCVKVGYSWFVYEESLRQYLFSPQKGERNKR